MAILTRKHLLAAMKAGKRIDATAFKNAPPWQQLRANGPWLKPFRAPIQRSSIEGLGSPDAGKARLVGFEDAADQARSRLSGGAPVAVVRRSELEAAIAEAADMLADPGARGVTPQQRSNMRQGLQMLGVHVAGDTDNDTTTTLRLANADLPFSLRFIACSFAMPLSLSSAGLVTLDLSGCAVKGIDATFLRLSGSLRLRRLYSSAPLDFTGARIHGFLDGADLVLQPFGRHPSAQAVSPERAMLGLNQVQIDNEIRLQRAQIWGGITMRGLEAKRSLYMSDAVVLCPLAVLEALAKLAVLPASRDPQGDPDYHLPGQGSHSRSRNPSDKWGERTWGRGWQQEITRTLNTMTLRFPGWKRLTLHALLTSNLRARTSAIRGDGIKIEGSVFMERLCSHGRVRMKYAQIAGGLTLAGARLRSTEALMPTFDQLAYAPGDNKVAHNIAAYRRQTYNDLVDPEDAADSGKVARGADIYALDLRESRIAGDVRIGITEADVPDEAGWNTQIDGGVAFDQAHFDGALRLERVKFRWSLRLLKLKDGEAIANKAAYRSFFKRARKALKSELWANRIHQLTARGLTTADSVSLCGSRSLKGADFSNATIGGELLFFRDSAHPDKKKEGNDATADVTKDRTRLKLEDPASGLSGASIRLEGTTIGGDLRLLFDPGPTQGPRIRAQRVTVSGLLSIMPPGEHVPLDAKSHCEVLEKIRSDRQKHRAWAAERRRVWAEQKVLEIQKVWDEKISVWKRDMPGIDFTNATATLLEFPSSAWPRAGRLIISGFSYQRALPHGPLAPHRLADDKNLNSKTKKREAFWTGCAIAFGVLGLVVVPLMGMYFDPKTPILFSSYLMLALLFAAASLYILVPRMTSPQSLNIAPMAIEWLQLQPLEVNAYRTRHSLGSLIWHPIGSVSGWVKPGLGNLFRSLEPYSIAADALRREGRWISANLVEQERFRVRNWQLSWRTHFLQKLSFKVADWMTEYGYNYARMLFATALVVILAGMTVEKAEDCGAIVPKVHKVNLLPPLTAPSRPDRMFCPTLRDGAKKVAEESNLDVMLFAVDTVVPIADLGEVADWEVSKEITALGPWSPDLIRKHVTYARLLGICHVLGLVLAGILLLGLSTRFGHWLSRYAD